ncbi:ArsR/SmtB family transcription factor [Herbiconiux sp. YIM B11900]|uniref:ArsR/SmtB family transcription factor n=1 Tax=Herbiconiux sp. YIM B11900 TaxID=3404131 RepID=UPI003F87B647
MVIREISEAETDAIFRALADSTRRDIVRRAIRQEQSISSLAERYTMSFAAVQKHVGVLERTALIEKTRRGKEQIVRANPDTLQRASRLLGEFEHLWRERLDRFGEVLTAPAPAAGPAPATGATPNPGSTTSSAPVEKGHRP